MLAAIITEPRDQLQLPSRSRLDRRLIVRVLKAQLADLDQLVDELRGEDVRIYHLRMKPSDARILLSNYLDSANDLAKNPRFYNTATTNCTTQVSAWPAPSTQACRSTRAFFSPAICLTTYTT